eukprot:7900474-Lingulodinium_polyedra.AAC.1
MARELATPANAPGHGGSVAMAPPVEWQTRPTDSLWGLGGQGRGWQRLLDHNNRRPAMQRHG